MTRMEIIKATTALLPDAIALVRALLDRMNGDVSAVRRELRRIEDHGARLDVAEASFDERIRKAEEKLGKGPVS